MSSLTSDKVIEPRPKRRLLPRWLKIALLCLLGLVAIWVAWRIYLVIAIRSEINAIHKAGEPFSLAELDDWYTIPPGKPNAANVLESAFAKCVQSDPQNPLELILANRPPAGQRWGEFYKEKVANYLALNAEALALLHKGALIDNCRYRTDLSRGGQPGDTAVWGEVILKLEAQAHLQDGDSAKAVSSVETMLGLARTFYQEPTYRAHEEGLFLQTGATETLEAVLGARGLEGNELVELARALRETQFAEAGALRRAIVGDRCVVWRMFGDEEVRRRLAVYHDTTLLGGESWFDRSLPARWGLRAHYWIWTATGLKSADRLSFLRLMRRAAETSESGPDWRADAAKIGEASKRLAGFHLVTKSCATKWEWTLKTSMSNAAQIRSAEAAVAVERYRMAESKLPAALNDVVPKHAEAIPIDPYDGQPLRYKLLANGYVVYSVGPDLKDDGGAPITFADDTSTGDIAFTVER